MSFLQIDHVTHTYFSLKEKTTAIKHINMEITQGEFISFIGPSGCGKQPCCPSSQALRHPLKVEF